MDKSTAGKVKKLSKKTPAGRAMPKGYKWGFCIDGDVVLTDSQVFAEMLKKEGITAVWVP